MVLLLVAGLILGGRYWSRGEDFSGLNGDVSFRQRLATSQAGSGHVRRSPAARRGTGMFGDCLAALCARRPLFPRTALVTHNTVIQPLAETGILGFLPFILFRRFRYLLRAQDWRWTLRAEAWPIWVRGWKSSLWGFVVCGLSGGYVLTWFPYILLGMVSSARRIRGES